MSLRKSPELTPALLAAARNNAQHSTGPRSAAAKENVKLNSLKHGGRVSDENRYQAMLALGEDPQEFENLKQELMSALTPGDALWEKQIDDLTWLYWRRDRLERAEAGLKRRALLAVEEWQHRRQQEIAGATFDASQPQAIDVDMTEPADPGVRLRMLLSFLVVIREQAKQRIFKPRQASEIETLYHNDVGWRHRRVRHWQESRHGTHIDDPTAPSLPHDRQDGAHHAHGAEKVRFQHRPDLVQAGFLDGAFHRNPCIVHQHVDASGLGYHTINTSSHGVVVADIKRQPRQGATTVVRAGWRDMP